jgi:hypothetical protein
MTSLHRTKKKQQTGTVDNDAEWQDREERDQTPEPTLIFLSPLVSSRPAFRI